MDNKEIRVHTDKRGKDHVDIYSNDPKDDHTSIHINIDTNTGKGTIVDTTSGSKETTDTQCYLTTACMRYYNKDFDDNCEELSILRWFRDKFVSLDDIMAYYVSAPIIVENINSLETIEERNNIYKYIYNNVVKYCTDAIKNKEYDKAYSRYKASVLTLEEQFLSLENDFTNKTYCLN